MPADLTVGDRFDRTIPRALVHRAAVSEVLVTDLEDTGADTFLVAAQWPRDHGFYRLRTGDHDPVLFAETLRQATLLVAHQGYGVPLDWKFLTHSKSYRVRGDRLAVGPRPADVLLVVRCRDVKRTPRGVRGMVLEVDGYRGREWIGSGSVTWSCVAPAGYARLRGAALAQPAAAGLPVPVPSWSVGRDRDHDVALGRSTGPRTWPLRVDRDHAVLFDHPVDHVPGMVLLEAARQAALLVLGTPDALPLALGMDFDKFVELTGPAVITAEPLPAPRARRVDARVRFRIEQSDQVVASGEVDLAVRA
ncbi:hypothetical protein BJP25_05470 [Actinokineospora bangkokensis]|uniref:A-factor biosynthesis hotdog domain-containing protein n=1 Tax=Actinokineospora bangkokensis TaxID=1193682 RepID=A0A1Q9LC57_9PSEU|nr:hypothetical protein BJP25_05470 [Actinokineospora bangkokensis]